MSIIVSTIYPDPRESERCRRSPLPRRSLEPWDVVDDRCEPSVLLETRLEPLRNAPAKADSLRSGFGFDPVMANAHAVANAHASDSFLFFVVVVRTGVLTGSGRCRSSR